MGLWRVDLGCCCELEWGLHVENVVIDLDGDVDDLLIRSR